jgi:hypothetical protein
MRVGPRIKGNECSRRSFKRRENWWVRLWKGMDLEISLESDRHGLELQLCYLWTMSYNVSELISSCASTSCAKLSNVLHPEQHPKTYHNYLTIVIWLLLTFLSFCSWSSNNTDPCSLLPEDVCNPGESSLPCLCLAHIVTSFRSNVISSERSFLDI